MKTEMLLDEAKSTASSSQTNGPVRGRRKDRLGARRSPEKIVGVVVGELVGLGGGGEPLVEFPGNRSFGPVACLSTLALGENAVGRKVILMFEEGDPTKPVLMGLVNDCASNAPPVDLLLDKRRLVLTAQEEIILCCGKASITLTRAGKVLIRGAYLLNRSSGVNRIKGGSVQIN